MLWYEREIPMSYAKLGKFKINMSFNRTNKIENGPNLRLGFRIKKLIKLLKNITLFHTLPHNSDS